MDLATLAEGLKPFIMRWMRPKVVWFAAVNGSGGALAAGDVVVVDTAADRQVTTSTTSAVLTVAGVVLVGGAAGATVHVATAGVVDMGVTGAVSRGTRLVHSTSAKLAYANPGATSAGVFAIAVEAAAGPGTGSVRALISVPTR